MLYGQKILTDEDIEAFVRYQEDYNRFIWEGMESRLTRHQRRIVESVQECRRTTVRSGHAYGKDYVAARIALSFLLLNIPSKVICTAPTGRQVHYIMMAELASCFTRAKKNRVTWSSYILSSEIKFPEEENRDWYLIGFKAGDKRPEDWTGFHSPNVLIVVTEASGVEDETFRAIEGLMTGNSRLLLLGNPTVNSGTFYDSFDDPKYERHELNCLRAPNVRAKKILIPGAVDYVWVKDMIDDHCTSISEELATRAHDFTFEGKWWRPTDDFIRKVLGDYPDEEELENKITSSQIEAAFKRYDELLSAGKLPEKHLPKKIGLDCSGMGSNESVWCERVDNVVTGWWNEKKSDPLELARKTRDKWNRVHDQIFVDAVGIGAGTFSMLRKYKKEENYEPDIFAVSAGKSGKKLKDETGLKTFKDVNAYMLWQIKRALEPRSGINIAIKRNALLKQELLTLEYYEDTERVISVIPKDEIKEKLGGRSPDYMDALKVTYFKAVRRGAGSYSTTTK